MSRWKDGCGNGVRLAASVRRTWTAIGGASTTPRCQSTEAAMLMIATRTRKRKALLRFFRRNSIRNSLAQKMRPCVRQRSVMPSSRCRHAIGVGPLQLQMVLQIKSRVAVSPARQKTVLCRSGIGRDAIHRIAASTTIAPLPHGKDNRTHRRYLSGYPPEFRAVSHGGSGALRAPREFVRRPLPLRFR